MNEDILVYPPEATTELSKSLFYTGTSVLRKILKTAFYMPRVEAEINTAFRQIIPYSLFRYQDQVFVYRRTTGGGEKRLHGKYAIGVGGHISRIDSALFGRHYYNMKIIEMARDREITEEFDISYRTMPQLIGIVNDESNDFGLMHIGIVYEYWLDRPWAISREGDKHSDINFLSIDELLTRAMEFESWSYIIIHKYLSKHRPSSSESFKTRIRTSYRSNYHKRTRRFIHPR